MNKLFSDNTIAVIPFIVAGDPTSGFTKRLISALQAAGADMVELGLPFSDPVAEGAVIQAGDERALTAGFTTDSLFALLRELPPGFPVSLRTYMNPIVNYGTERFIRMAADCGVYAIAVPDVPYEERDELHGLCRDAGVHLINVVAPTSQDRVKAIANGAAGYIRCMSSPGVSEVAGEFSDMYHLVRRVSTLPCVMEIAAPDMLNALPQGVNGVIINQSVVELIERHGEDAVASAAALVREMIEGLR